MRRGHQPLRTCAGCRARAPQAELLRARRTPGGEIEFDVAGSEAGRGAYVHRSATCLTEALARGGLARALRADVGSDAASRLTDRFTEMQERA